MIRRRGTGADANTLLSMTDHCLRSPHVNVIVAGKQPTPPSGSTCMPRHRQ
jgi:phosphoketolase